MSLDLIVNENCLEEYDAMKMKQTYKFIIFVIKNDSEVKIQNICKSLYRLKLKQKQPQTLHFLLFLNISQQKNLAIFSQHLVLKVMKFHQEIFLKC